MIVGLRFFGACAVLCLAVTGCGLSASSATPTPIVAVPQPVPTVAFVHTSPIPRGKFSVALVTDVGGLGDKSFNDLAWKAIRHARVRYHAKIQVVQSPSEAAYLPELTRLAIRRPSLIVAVGGSMASAVYDAAGKYPAQRFVLIDARPTSAPGHEVAVANVANILFREQDAGFVAGVLAGLVERHHVGHARHNTIGYLGAFAIPQITRYLAGFVAGAKTVDHSVKVIGQFAGTYTDPKLGKSIALSQVHQGADVLFQVAAETGAAYLSTANSRAVFGIGSDVNQSYLGPYVLTSAIKRVDVALAQVLRDDVRGQFRPGDNQFGASNGGTGIAPPTSAVPGSIVSMARQYQAIVAQGTSVPPVTIPAR